MARKLKGKAKLPHISSGGREGGEGGKGSRTSHDHALLRPALLGKSVCLLLSLLVLLNLLTLLPLAKGLIERNALTRGMGGWEGGGRRKR